MMSIHTMSPDHAPFRVLSLHHLRVPDAHVATRSTSMARWVTTSPSWWASSSAFATLSHLRSFHCTAVGLSRFEPLLKLLSRDACIGIKIKPSNYRHAFGSRGDVVMLAKERFQIFPINVAVFPIIYCLKRLLNIETLCCIHFLFKLLCHSIQGNLSKSGSKARYVMSENGDLLFEKSCEFWLNIIVKMVMSVNLVNIPLSDYGP